MTDEQHAAQAGANSAEEQVWVEGETQFVEQDFIAPFLVMRKRASRVSMFAVCSALLLVSVMLVGRQAWLAGFAGAVGAVFGFLGVWHSIGPRYLARQHILGVNDDELAVRFRFDQEGMTISGSWGTSFYRYRGIHAYSEYRATFLVQTGPVLRMVVPKRAFSPADLETVRGLLTSKVKPRISASGGAGSGLIWRYVALWIAVLLLVLIAAGVIDVRGL
jgi:hypothetical protein